MLKTCFRNNCGERRVLYALPHPEADLHDGDFAGIFFSLSFQLHSCKQGKAIKKFPQLREHWNEVPATFAALLCFIKPVNNYMTWVIQPGLESDLSCYFFDLWLHLSLSALTCDLICTCQIYLLSTLKYNKSKLGVVRL